MSERIALIGFVNTEEVLADTIKTQTPTVKVDGYELFPSEAFGRRVDNRYKLYGLDEDGNFGHYHIDVLNNLLNLKYSAVNVGPIPAALITEPKLLNMNLDYIGPRTKELEYETDKSKIFDIFPTTTNILPPTVVIDDTDLKSLSKIQDNLGDELVFKFVGDYTNYYKDSEARRVRMISEFEDSDQLSQFLSHSIESSGKAVIQKLIDGQQFCYTCLVDGNNGVFRCGENICYKHRFDDETGPLCDGTGALSENNTLPNILSPADLEYIKTKIVEPYCNYLNDKLGRAPKTFLNLDLIKSDTGIYLLEVNGREPGGHTMANLMNGLRTPLAEVFQATQEGQLSKLKPQFKKGASVVVSAYPKTFPYPFDESVDRPNIVVPKLKADDLVRVYTGWVNVIEEHSDSVLVEPNLSPTMLFANHSSTIAEARKNVYARISEIVPDQFDFRKDIGLQKI